MPIATVDPTTGRTLKAFDALTPAELEDRLARAAAAARTYRRTSFEERAQWCRAAADLLDADKDTLAELMTTEMGKTLAASRAEIGKCASGLRHYAEAAPGMLADVPADASAVGASKAYTHYQPLGVVLAVMPWNYPLWQAMRFAAPALMAGNVGLLKHASNVPQTALWLEELFRRGGLPCGRLPDAAHRLGPGRDGPA
jgi:succinate-semialdehyde dehydrogenase/glutarate-semialdehyde dehydrogenase